MKIKTFKRWGKIDRIILKLDTGEELHDCVALIFVSFLLKSMDNIKTKFVWVKRKLQLFVI